MTFAIELFSSISQINIYIYIYGHHQKKEYGENIKTFNIFFYGDLWFSTFLDWRFGIVYMGVVSVVNRCNYSWFSRVLKEWW